MITGRKSIGEKFNINENKIQRILKKFENQHQIEQQMSNKNRLITIKNWGQYQISDNQTTTTEQQVNTNKNIKNINIILSKYIKSQPKTLFEKMKLLREIKSKENLLPEQETEIENYILGLG